MMLKLSPGDRHFEMLLSSRGRHHSRDAALLRNNTPNEKRLEEEVWCLSCLEAHFGGTTF